MAPLSENALLQVIRIRSAANHALIMVRFQNKYIRMGCSPFNGRCNRAQIRGIRNLRIAVIDGIPDGPRRIMRNFKGNDTDCAV